MGGRSHDYHCPKCHTWIDGFSVPDDLICGDDCDGRLFYDLNNEGCNGEDDPCWDDGFEDRVLPERTE